MKRMHAWLLALLMLLGSTALAEVPDDTLTVGTTTAMSGSFMHGMFGSNTSDIDVRRLLHGHSLTYFDADGTGTYLFNRTVVPNTRMEYEGGGNFYTLTLGKNLHFSDGTPITAKDYAFAILLALSPEAAALGVSPRTMDHIGGADAFIAGETNVLSGVRCPDDYTIIIHVTHDFSPYFYTLSLLDIVPFPISVIAPGCEVVSTRDGCYIQDIGGGDTIFTTELLAKTLLDPDTGYVTHPTVVSGPYTLESYDAAASVATFRRNPYYSGNADGVKPSIERVVFRLVTNEEAADLLASGQIDLMHKAMNPALLDATASLVEAGELCSTAYDRSGLSYVSFSCELPTVSSVAVRQAIAHCFDKEAFIAMTLGGNGVAVNGFYGMGQWMVSKVGTHTLAKLPAYAPDAQAAIDLLEADGWTLNADGIRQKEIDGEIITLSLTLLYPEGNAAGAWLETEFVQSLAAVGIDLTVEAWSYTDLLRVYYREEPRDVDMIFLASNFGTVFEPSDLFNPAPEAQGYENRTGIADMELYELAVALRRTAPGANTAYAEKWLHMQQRFAEVLPVLPIASNVYYDLYTPALTGYDVVSAQTWAEAIIGAELER